MLIVKDLIFCDPEDSMLVSDFVRIFGRSFLTFYDTMTVGEAFVKFKQSKSHLAVVMENVTNKHDTDPCIKVVGILTLEDTLEEFINDEILDETDYHERVERGLQVLIHIFKFEDYKNNKIQKKVRSSL